MLWQESHGEQKRRVYLVCGKVGPQQTNLCLSVFLLCSGDVCCKSLRSVKCLVVYGVTRQHFKDQHKIYRHASSL